MKTCLVFLFAIVALAAAANVSCPPVDDEHGEAVVLPHESDCSKFYLCSNGVPWELSCKEGLYFNTETNTCDWQENVNCSNVGTTPGGQK
ncbi:peritrophin-1-like [Phlebotomus papatasi]|uniref:Peritrophin-like protein n=1 Tax=Phlebotomus papatasi TaxID=29031 RepID=A8CAG4_PHLPP|nr:peritrophin-1-like [Phlebotomus papatasi]ABV44753.1 peritrophin-like protein [Phlebotomus papatasi]